MLVSPYKNVIQYSKIQLKPFHLNSEIESNMKFVLCKKVEKKCNKNGFVDTVHSIEKYIENDLRPENLSGCVNYDISYNCRLCLPIENTIIIAQIKSINQELVISVNGPIIMFIPKENVDNDVWDISNNFKNLETNENLKINSFVNVEVINKRINYNDSQIKVIGKLIKFSTKEEIENYYGLIINDEENNETDEDNENIKNKEESNFII